jgi:hypothetical protein
MVVQQICKKLSKHFQLYLWSQNYFNNKPDRRVKKGKITWVSFINLYAKKWQQKCLQAKPNSV